MAGRPLKYETVEELEKAIEEYFENLEADEPATITELAFHLGFESRQSFYDYEEKPEFTYTIKRARLQVEIGYEKRLSSPVCTGAIFALKNLGWKDKTEVDQNTNMNIVWNEERTYEK